MFSKDERGLVLVIVLGLVLLFVLAFAYFMLMSTREIQAVKSQDEFIRAFYLAEAGFEKTRYFSNQDSNWSDRYFGDPDDPIDCGENVPDLANFYALPYTSTSLGGGYYNVMLKNADEDGDEVADDDVIWVKSRGTYYGKSRAIQAKLISARQYDDLANNVTSAIETEGSITIQGSAEINGEYVEYVDISFDDIFGMSKSEMDEVVQDNFPDTYYGDEEGEVPFSNDTATEVTWISSTEAQSQITENGWSGNGILIVDGDLKITGGTFDGIIWVFGELSVSGNPTINGGLFVESGVTVDTTVTGNATINYDSDDVDYAFSVLSSSLPATVEEWQEVSP